MSQEVLDYKLPSEPGSSDALHRLKVLENELRAESVAATTPQPIAAKSAADRLRRPLKCVLAAAVAVVLGWVPVNRLLVTSSAEATVNARLVTLRAPIDGVVDGLMPVADTEARSGVIFKISNRRSDRGHLDELQRLVLQAEADRDALRDRHARLVPLLVAYREQTDAFKAARVAQLSARSAELKAEIAVADARVVEAKAALGRAAQLQPSGYVSGATYEKAERDFKVLNETANASRSRLEGTEIEMAAARRGIFVGDSYNDTPQSAQRATELEQQIGDIAIQLAASEKRLQLAHDTLAAEQNAYALRSAADVALPNKGRVWERLVTTGEEVRQGQDLLRVLDCGQAVVTATVTESNYDTLRIGDKAAFRFRDGGDEMDGWIVSLNGLAAVPGNFAIDQRAMSRERFHVTVYVPELANARDCGIGRSGRVVFGKDDVRSFAGAILFAAVR